MQIFQKRHLYSASQMHNCIRFHNCRKHQSTHCNRSHSLRRIFSVYRCFSLPMQSSRPAPKKLPKFPRFVTLLIVSAYNHTKYLSNVKQNFRSNQTTLCQIRSPSWFRFDKSGMLQCKRVRTDNQPQPVSILKSSFRDGLHQSPQSKAHTTG